MWWSFWVSLATDEILVCRPTGIADLLQILPERMKGLSHLLKPNILFAAVYFLFKAGKRAIIVDDFRMRRGSGSAS
jgi:hypothetical protein